MVVENLIFNIRRQGDAAAAGVNNLGRAMTRLKGAANTATKHTNKFLSSLARIAMYRAVRRIIKGIEDALNEGLKNAYAFSQGINTEGHRFSQALDSMASSSLKMKNQLGSAFIGLLAAIAPIVNTIIALITRLANAMSQLFAVFTGGTYLKAKDVSAQFADNMASGAGSAKEWKNQLLGFDVINRLEEPSSGGGGGGADLNPMDMFEDTQIDGIFAKMRDKLLELKDSLDFSKIKESWEGLKESFQGVLDTLGRAVSWVWENILAPFIKWWIENWMPAVIDLISAILDLVNVLMQKLGPVLEDIWENYIKPVAQWIGENLVTVIKEVTRTLESMTQKLSDSTSFDDFISSLSGTESTLLGVMMVVGLFIAILFAVNHPILTITLAVAALAIWIATHWEEIKQKTEELKKKVTEKIENIKKKLDEWKQKSSEVTQAIGGFFSGLLSPVASVVSSIISWIQSIISVCSSAISAIRQLHSEQFSGTTPAETMWNGGLYASGGFPDEGEFFLARENGPEMVGTIGGRTAVANNAQIVSAIEGGVFRAMSSALGSSNNSKGKGEVVLNVNGREFMRAVYADGQAVAREHGVSLVANA